MPYTFADCYRTVRLHAPVAPLFLCRTWVNTAWESLASRRSWSFLRGELTLSIRAARTPVVSVAQGDILVSSTGAFVADDAGRQFRIGAGPIYTIQTVIDANSVQLDRAYTEASVAATDATIADLYATMPADFGRFEVVVDRSRRRPIPFWLSSAQLALADADRSQTDSSPRGLVAATPSTYGPTLGRIRYEYYPAVHTAQTLQAVYHKQADQLVDTDLFTGVLADGGKVLITGALAQAAAWPGTAQLKNPYFNLQLAQLKQQEFEWGVQRLALKDDNHYRNDLEYASDGEGSPSANLSGGDATLRASDATLAAYY